jgi:hypothetical protein
LGFFLLAMPGSPSPSLFFILVKTFSLELRLVQ